MASALVPGQLKQRILSKVRSDTSLLSTRYDDDDALLNSNRGRGAGIDCNNNAIRSTSPSSTAAAAAASDTDISTAAVASVCDPSVVAAARAIAKKLLRASKCQAWDVVLDILQKLCNLLLDSALEYGGDGASVSPDPSSSATSLLLKPLRDLYHRDSLQEAKQLIVGEISDARDVRYGNTLGHFAAAANQVVVLRLLHELGVFLRKSNFSNRSPMQEARQRQQTEALDFLLLNAFKPVERLFYGDDSYDSMVKVFTDYPEAINSTLDCYSNMTWVAMCVEEARLRELRWLYEHGGDFEVRDECGNTLLHMIQLTEAEEIDDDNEVDSSETSSSSDAKSTASSEEEARRRDEKGGALSATDPTNSRNSTRRSATHGTEGDCEKAHIPTTTKKAFEACTTTVEAPVDDDDDSKERWSLVREILGEGAADLNEEEKATLCVLLFLLKDVGLSPNALNNSGATPAHSIAEKAGRNPPLTWQALRLLKHYGTDINAKDSDGANVAMVLAGACGDGPWISWCLSEESAGGAGCDPNAADVQGRCLEDHIVRATLETFDDELDIDEESEEEEEDSSSSDSEQSSSSCVPSYCSEDSGNNDMHFVEKNSKTTCNIFISDGGKLEDTEAPNIM